MTVLSKTLLNISTIHKCIFPLLNVYQHKWWNYEHYKFIALTERHPSDKKVLA
jgi:hypothetical protein